MTLILELEPKIERQLERDAAQANMTLEAWALQLLKTKTTTPDKTKQGLDKAEIARRLKLMDEFVEAEHEYSKGTESLSDYAISREAMYTPYDEERNSVFRAADFV